MTGSSAVRLPPRGGLTPTTPIDAVERYYRPGIGWVLQRRLKWVVEQVATRSPVDRLLEVGYGSGIFLYELAGRAVDLHGIDVHPKASDVRRQLAHLGVGVSLTQGSGMVLPFRDGSFDAVVVVSALEFMDDPEQCLREMLRVVRPGGQVICVTPRIHSWADRLYRALVGFDPESEFHGGRHRVQRALETFRSPMKRLLRPRFCPAAIAPYELVVLTRESP